MESATNNNSDTAAILINMLTAAGLEPKQVGNSTFIVTPKDYALHDVTDAGEKSQPTPSRKRGTVHLADVPSLLQHMADQDCSVNGYAYADLDARTITAVFNDNKHAIEPGWRDHRAVFSAVYTPEFKLWLANDKKQFTQTDFAEFIEDNFPDIDGEHAGNLQKVALTISAKTGIEFKSAQRLQDGQTQLTYNEIINATAGDAGSLTIPQKFNLGLRIFANGGGYALTARLKYRLGAGGVKFHYELERPERAVEDAFNGYVEAVRSLSGYAVLLGKA